MTKKIFNSSELAQLWNVAPRTVSKWYDSGLLRGYRTPGTANRFYPLESVIEFAESRGLPLPIPTEPEKPLTEIEKAEDLTVSLTPLLRYLIRETYDKGHGLLGPPNWVVDMNPLIRRIEADLGFSRQRMSELIAEIQAETYGGSKIDYLS